MEYLKTIVVADENDRIRISCLINESGSFVMPSLVIYSEDYQRELWNADGETWIKETLLPALISKTNPDEDVKELRTLLKQQGLKRNHVIKVIQEAIKMKML